MSSVRHYTRWPIVEGYCTEQSYLPGDEVEVHCSSRADTFAVEVFRVGASRELVWSEHSIQGDEHPVPERVWEIGCGWPVTFRIPTTEQWASGYYEISLSTVDQDGPESRSEAFFVLRGRPDDQSSSLLVLSTSTYNAYNQWGGGCLYTGEHKVSFHRPLERGYLRRESAPTEVEFDGRACNVARPSDPTHAQLAMYQREGHYPLWCNSAGWHNWERRFVAWAESNGLLFDYATSQDLHRDANLLAHRQLLLTVGHDEYWSAGMRDAVDSFVSDGGNWALFSGDTCTWQVRFEDDESSMVCYKDTGADPVSDTPQWALTTTMWSDPFLQRPETHTHGLSFTRGGYHRIGLAVPDGSGGFTVHRPAHWAFAGLDLSKSDIIGSTDFAVGYEVDGCALRFDGGSPVPTHEDGSPDNLSVLATAPARLISINDEVCEAPAALWASLDGPGDLEVVAAMLFGDASAAHTARLAETYAVIADFTKGDGYVFHCGSADWAYGLDRDRVIQQITLTVIDRLSQAGPGAAT